MEYTVLLNTIMMASMDKIKEIMANYEEKTNFDEFDKHQRIMDIILHKDNAIKMIKEEAFIEAYMALMLLSLEKKKMSKEEFESMLSYPMVIFFEAIGHMEPKNIIGLLNNYHDELPSMIVETCIFNLPSNMQEGAIKKYHEKLNPEEDMFFSFYYSVSDESRKILRSYFEQIEDDILLELEDEKSENLAECFEKYEDRLLKQSADDLVEFILLKTKNVEVFNKFIRLFERKLNEVSIAKFQLFMARYLYLCDRIYYDNDKPEIIEQEELFEVFKDRFREMGIINSLSMFGLKSENINARGTDFKYKIIFEFIDEIYEGVDLTEYLTTKETLNIIELIEKKAREKNYIKEDLETLIKNIKESEKNKCFHNDIIDAVVACGYLLKENIINNKDPLFIELRNIFITDLMSRINKDGTYNEQISLNSIFYRLAKGSISFKDIYSIETYKGLIYATKAGKDITKADEITDRLTDEQVHKVNISPVLKWVNVLDKENTNEYEILFRKRMGLQLFLYFGKDKAKYLLESEMPFNRMENLFDDLNYKELLIDEKGVSIKNTELIDFLFGRGMMREPNSIMNKIIRDEIPEFSDWLSDFCNNYEDIKIACNGVLSLKRIANYYNNKDIGIELKPDEIEFKRSLNNMKTTNKGTLEEAIGLCKDARDRYYSTIPKVEGTLGDFSYEILDLKDPLAVSVGDLSHCCFVVRGISYTALKHSMRSENGRTFVVYYKNHFLAQSWIWRNGDVICFDSVEAGSPVHGAYEDDIHIVDVYKKVAREIIDISEATEDEKEKVKLVTVGRSDYILEDIEKINIVPRPMEDDVYVYDSSIQYLLAGEVPENIRYGKVSAKYKDRRKAPVIINNVDIKDIDKLDELSININSLRYRLNNMENPIDYTKCSKILSGDGWYIIIYNNGTNESGCIDEYDALDEYKSYMNSYGLKTDNYVDESDVIVKPTVVFKKRKVND